MQKNYINNDRDLPPYYSLSNIRLLIIDDDEALARSIKFFFEDHECDVITVNSGEMGIKKFNEEKPDIVLVDLNMPGMGGHSVISHLTRTSPDTPIIVISGTGVIKEAIRSMNLGAWDFVSKPIMNFEELEMSVLRVLEKSFLLKENRTYKTNLEKLIIERTSELENKKSQLELTINELKEAKEKAEKSESLKSEFLAQMSHEIRTPLNTIISYINILQQEIGYLPTLLNPNEFVDIKNASNRLIRTIELILNMSELQVGTYEYHFEPVDMKKLLLETMFNYEDKIRTKGLALKLNLPSEEIVTLADVYSVGQIMNNLIDNAYKFTNKGEIEISLSNLGNNFLLEINDTGVGISDEYKKQLYSPFTQEENGYTRSYEGNGLGLALAKNYCALNSIDIRIESQKHKGTRVTLLIPNKLKQLNESFNKE